MKQSRFFLTLLLIVCFLLTGAVREWVFDEHEELVIKREGGGSLNNLNSFSLALFLGGLRGPLVMWLWPSIENQKFARDLEDIDTKIEMVRLLQAEFDSVHIFQIWNKAYNLSVQMASKSNKYSMILDALDYAKRVNNEKPNDINIVSQIGSLYLDKFGKSEEHVYYSDRLRRESRMQKGQTLKQLDPNSPHMTVFDEDGRPIVEDKNRHRIFLLENGHIIPEYKTDELKYLVQYDDDGFPYGLSPFALAYNYFKAAQVLHDPPYSQKHIQASDYVMEIQPSIALRHWSEELWERGLACESKAYGFKPIPDRVLMQEVTAPLALDATTNDVEGIREALFCYKRAIQLAKDANREYARQKSGANAALTTMHEASMDAEIHMLEADTAYLKAITATPQERTVLLKKAAEEYQKTIDAWYLIVLRFYTEDDVVAAIYPPDPKQPGQRFNKRTIGEYDPKGYPALYDAVVKVTTMRKREDLHSGERDEYRRYIERARERLGCVGKALAN